MVKFMRNMRLDRFACFRKRPALWSLTGIIVAIMMLLNGCADDAGIKAPTDKTPDSRVNTRHTFPNLNPQENSQDQETRKSELKVGFLYIGRSGDYGFTYAQNQGRLALMSELGVETMVRENVPEDIRCMDEIQSLIDSGCSVIFSCSYGFMDYTVAMAEKYPDVTFFHCSGYETRENLSAYFGRMYQVRYLTGIVAGLRTETNKIGYVAAYPIPEVIRGANAFALGVKSVNPDAEVAISWSRSWFDTGLEKELTLELIRSKCDVIAQHQDSLLPQIAAEEEGVWSIGYHSPMGFFSPNAYLTGAVWNWKPYMIEQIKQIENGTWKSSDYWGGLEDDIVQLDALTENVAPGTQEAVDKAIRRIKDGFDVFEGPVYDNQGNLRISHGEILSDDEKLNMDWLVDNITGGIN